MKINFMGAVRDSSGYAEFSRNFIVALHTLGADLTVSPITFEKEHADHGEPGRICAALCKKPRTNSDINIVNMIPKFFKDYRKPNTFNVGFTMFEASRICDEWVSQCNEMDAILVPSEYNRKVFANSGVTVPIEVAQCGVGKIYYNDLLTKPINDKYRFLSVFQWSERKNPLGLIRAYWSAFTGRDDVILIIKTYGKDYSKETRDGIIAQINQLKNNVYLKHYPAIELHMDKISSEQVRALYMSSDCFVLPHRSEGVGLGCMEAMACGLPVIATNHGGNTDFMNENNSYLLNYQMTPVMNMPIGGGWYNGTMWWAEPNLKDLADKMIAVEADRQNATNVGQRARETILKDFNWERLGQQMLDILNSLCEGRGGKV